MESIQNQLQEIKQTKLAKLIAVTNGEVVVIKKKGNNKGFTTYKVEKEEYIYPAGFNKFCEKNRQKLKIKITECKHISQVILQTFDYINLTKNKINKPIYSINNFKQTSI